MRNQEAGADHPNIKNSAQNEIFISAKKPAMNYIMHCIDMFGKMDRIVLKARGSAMKTAIDITLLLQEKFNPQMNIKRKSIDIQTEQIEDKDKKKFNISSIHIALEK